MIHALAILGNLSILAAFLWRALRWRNVPWGMCISEIASCWLAFFQEVWGFSVTVEVYHHRYSAFDAAQAFLMLFVASGAWEVRDSFSGWEAITAAYGGFFILVCIEYGIADYGHPDRANWIYRNLREPFDIFNAYLLAGLCMLKPSRISGRRIHNEFQRSVSEGASGTQGKWS